MELKSISLVLLLVFFHHIKYSQTLYMSELDIEELQDLDPSEQHELEPVQTQDQSAFAYHFQKPAFRYELIDNLKHLTSLDWQGHPIVKKLDQRTLEDLPRELAPVVRGLHGNGIIYFDGTSNSVNQAVFKQKVEDLEPGLLYIKYFMYANPGSDKGNRYSYKNRKQSLAYAAPSSQPDQSVVTFLPSVASSPGTTWNEIIVPLDVPTAVEMGIEVGTVNLGDGDFFLIEKMALVQGKQMDIEQIRELFSKPTKPEQEE